ncbi:BON domain-containing protein [Sorangium cellulosum]|uniref:BON domain-containing protein n=1 Tax=Sorangium cellulosum TaxID=56 RepID=A0A150QC26_SORCE|nr:BON domain-containing protein [Sorangium cellulosum]KYF65178.1 hypothetical protein BE15_01545 [Sorangium cellulosum]
MRDRFERDTGYGRAERGWDQRYQGERSHFTEHGWNPDERRSAGPMYDHGAALRDNRDWGREHARTYGPTGQRDDARRSLEDRRLDGVDRDAGDPDRGWSHGGHDPSRSFGGNPLPASGSAYSFNLGGAYHLGMTRVVSPEEAWSDGPYLGEGHDRRESGRSALEGVSHTLGAIGDRVRSAFGRGPKGYKRSDARIQEDICEMLSYRNDIDVSDVTVEVQSNEVTLEGTVPQRNHKRIIEQVAESVRGVEDVHNRIRVQRAIEPTTEPTTRSTATAGTMGDAALAATPQGAPRPTESHTARI